MATKTQGETRQTVRTAFCGNCRRRVPVIDHIFDLPYCSMCGDETKLAAPEHRTAPMPSLAEQYGR